MKIKLKFDRDELKGFITILEIIEHMPEKDDLTRYLFGHEAGKMKEALTQRMIYNSTKKSFNVSLTNFQTVICFGLMRLYAFDFMLFEKAIALRIIADIDKQYQNHKQVMINFSNQGKI